MARVTVSRLEVDTEGDAAFGGQLLVDADLDAQLADLQANYPSLSSEAVERRRVRPSQLLSLGVAPFLFSADVASTILAASVADVPFHRALLLAAAVVLVLGWFDQYRSRLTLSALNHAPALLMGPLLAAGIVGGFFGLHAKAPGTVEGLLSAGAIASGFILMGRIVAFACLRGLRRQGIIEHRVLILGAGEVAYRLVSVLQQRREFGLCPVAVWDEDPMLDQRSLGVPVIGKDQHLADAISAYQASVVIIAFAKHPESGMVDVVRTCDRMQSEIFVVPRLFELHHRSSLMDEVRGLPLMRLRRAAFRTWRWHVKRLFDVVVTATLLGVLAPVLTVCALAVAWEGRGLGAGVLFRQRRIGLDSRPFELLKFRSLLPADEAESSTLWSIAQDHRVGPVGRFMRRLSLDELPQLWNVLRGDMTLVGPRPERPHFVKQFTADFPRYVARHRVPAGVTGWAQVHGLRGDTSIEERAAFDNYYIENWSLWLDVTILLRTLRAVVSREGS